MCSNIKMLFTSQPAACWLQAHHCPHSSIAPPVGCVMHRVGVGWVKRRGEVRAMSDGCDRSLCSQSSQLICFTCTTMHKMKGVCVGVGGGGEKQGEEGVGHAHQPVHAHANMSMCPVSSQPICFTCRRKAAAGEGGGVGHPHQKVNGHADRSLCSKSSQLICFTCGIEAMTGVGAGGRA